jgi:tetratricopeptide (TPR) repeat protein
MYHAVNCKCEKYLEQGFKAIQEERWADAEKTYKKALNVHIDNPTAWGNIGLAYYELGDFEKAMHSFNESLKYNPKNKHALVSKGSLLARQGKLKEAIIFFNKSLQVDPNFQTALSNLNKANRELDQRQKNKDVDLIIIKKGEKYYLSYQNELLRTPGGNIISRNSPELLEAIQSDLSGQGKLIIENGILLQPRCLSAYVLISSTIDFKGDWSSFTDSFPTYLHSYDPIFSSIAEHPIIAMYQRQPKIEEFFKENNLVLKKQYQYEKAEWENLINFFMDLFEDFTIYQKSALANLAWPNEKNFVSTIMFLTGRYDKHEWAKAVFSSTSHVYLLIGETSTGKPVKYSEECMIGLIGALEEDASIVQQFLEITKET